MTRCLFVALFLFCLPLSGLPKGVHYSVIEGIHVLEVDPKGVTIVPAHAMDSGLGVETVRSIAKRHSAIAAINGGFYKMTERYDGMPAGILKINGKWYGTPTRRRGAIGWNGHKAMIDRLLTEVKVNSEVIDGINQQQQAGAKILYLPTFHPTTLTYPGDGEVTFEDGRVTAVTVEGSSPIPTNGGVVVGMPLKVGEKLTWSIQVKSHLGEDNWDQMDHIVGGTPVLIHNGEKVVDFTPEQTVDDFRNELHARAAIGLKPNGHWVFVVADDKGQITIPQLATFMMELGCVDAVNLGGGRSSTLVIEGEVVSSHGEDGDIPVGDAILIIYKRPFLL